MPKPLHSRVHHVSHFQAALIDGAAGTVYPDDPFGAALATFTPTGIVVACAWDDNATTAPEVRLEVVYASVAPVPASAGALVPIGVGEVTIGTAGVEIGNWITNDIARVAVPPGRHRVAVLLDTSEPFKARIVRFHLWPL